MKPLDYFASHPVFRLEDFTAAHQAGKALKPDSSMAAVKQHIRAENLLRIRRGVYAVVPRGQTPDTVIVDPYGVPFLTATKAKRFVFRGTEFVPVPVPPPLRRLPDLGGGVVEKLRDGVTVRVTTLERTLVDVLDAPRP